MEFKFKFNGQKVKARLLEDGEVINERCLQTVPFPEGMDDDKRDEFRNSLTKERLASFDWFPSSCVGEKTTENGHEWRIYIEVLSPFFVPVSTDGLSQ